MVGLPWDGKAVVNYVSQVVSDMRLHAQKPPLNMTVMLFSGHHALYEPRRTIPQCIQVSGRTSHSEAASHTSLYPSIVYSVNDQVSMKYTTPIFLGEQFTRLLPPLQADLTEKTVLVTGANAGIGFELAKHFAALRPARLVLGCRSEQKGRDAIASALS